MGSVTDKSSVKTGHGVFSYSGMFYDVLADSERKRLPVRQLISDVWSILHTVTKGRELSTKANVSYL